MVVGIEAQLKARAAELGFDVCRVAAAQTAPHAASFFDWIAGGQHGDMQWLAREPERRTDPRLVLAGARAVVVVAANYYQADAARSAPGRFARYAWGLDYHDILLTQLEHLAAVLEAAGGVQKCYVDTGPVLERDFAAEAGVGWQGKSTLCVNERLGTWFFLGTVLTTLPLEPDPPARGRCGTCRRCLDACPTGALTGPYRLEATRCLSYLTIEHQGSIPEEFRRALGDRIYGCDDCLEACPWNRFATRTRELRFFETAAVREYSLAEFASLSEEEFRTVFRRSPVKRLKWRRFMRNVCVALGNAGVETDLAALRRLERCGDALVAEHARWAIDEIRARNSPASLEGRPDVLRLPEGGRAGVVRG
ncbi:MAG: tRNA epoxyqueuosine(34) reductase QueG [Verrucomicrobia bacterium]|nr:tRNA epoxyqueuosine(34) reductase QueG [Verrucomicrobiota bacterium]